MATGWPGLADISRDFLAWEVGLEGGVFGWPFRVAGFGPVAPAEECPLGDSEPAWPEAALPELEVRPEGGICPEEVVLPEGVGLPEDELAPEGAGPPARDFSPEGGETLTPEEGQSGEVEGLSEGGAFSSEKRSDLRPGKEASVPGAPVEVFGPNPADSPGLETGWSGPGEEN